MMKQNLAVTQTQKKLATELKSGQIEIFLKSKKALSFHVLVDE